MQNPPLLHCAGRSHWLLVWLCCMLSYWPSANAQTGKDAPYTALQREIDAKRTQLIGIEEYGPRSREFLRIDSTYYVGWMLKGDFEFERAADYLGYRMAANSYQKALQLLEHDFAHTLSIHSSSLHVYYPAYPRQADYAQIVNNLVQCYNNTDDPSATYNTLRRYQKWNFQKSFIDVYNMLMWVVHRNRFYTSARYSFLKNSIAENEAFANRMLDSGLVQIEKEAQYNAGIFPNSSLASDRLGVYHYKAILHSYSLQIDSAQYYYDQMRDGGMMSYNNYANFRSICGDFRTAEENYEMAAVMETGDHRMQEWAYYSSILNIYKAQPKAGILTADEQIKAGGSTPGYGWNQIARARALAYDGQIDNAEKAIAKAAGFKELHIGTTLGQSHYDFAVQMVKLLIAQRRLEMVRFENRGWWYRPSAIGQMVKSRGMLGLQRFLIINQFAQNPERDLVIYKLFSSESVVGWDEIMILISGFSTNYFLKKFEPEIQSDNRPRIRKYYRYAVARLLMQKGKWKEAKAQLQSINPTDEASDAEYEKLLFARKALALAEIADHEGEDNVRTGYLIEAAEWYPQLLPFSEMKLPIRIKYSGATDAKVVSRLERCNFELHPSGDALTAYLTFENAGENAMRVKYYTVLPNGKLLVPEQTCTYDKRKPEGAALGLAYRIFGADGTVTEEKEDNTVAEGY